MVGQDGAMVEANAALAANRSYETIEEEVRHYPLSRLFISQCTNAMCLARVTECWKTICSSFPQRILSVWRFSGAQPMWEIR